MLIKIFKNKLNQNIYEIKIIFDKINESKASTIRQMNYLVGQLFIQ